VADSARGQSRASQNDDGLSASSAKAFGERENSSSVLLHESGRRGRLTAPITETGWLCILAYKYTHVRLLHVGAGKKFLEDKFPIPVEQSARSYEPARAKEFHTRRHGEPRDHRLLCFKYIMLEHVFRTMRYSWALTTGADGWNPAVPSGDDSNLAVYQRAEGGLVLILPIDGEERNFLAALTRMAASVADTSSVGKHENLRRVLRRRELTL